MRLTIRTLPEDADLEIDGVYVPNPYDQLHPWDSEERLVVARRKGYSEMSQRVSFGEDWEVTVHLHLEQKPPDCKRLEACLDKYRNPAASPAQMSEMDTTAKRTCFSDDPSLRASQAGCRLAPMGTDPRNGKSLKLQYFCSDVCPTQGGVTLIYNDVPQDQCCAVGGYPFFDPAWGGYRGCSPIMRSSGRVMMPRNKDAIPELATTDPCRPHIFTFSDGQVVDSRDLL